MASTGYFVRPKLTDEERKELQKLMDKVMEERERRRELYGPIDVAALIREVREEQADDETGRSSLGSGPMP